MGTNLRIKVTCNSKNSGDYLKIRHFLNKKGEHNPQGEDFYKFCFGHFSPQTTWNYHGLLKALSGNFPDIMFCIEEVIFNNCELPHMRYFYLGGELLTEYWLGSKFPTQAKFKAGLNKSNKYWEKQYRKTEKIQKERELNEKKAELAKLKAEVKKLQTDI